MSRTEDPRQATVKELIERIAEARGTLDAVVEPLTPSDREVPLGGSWSVKLHLSHIADWEVGILALLRRESRIDAMGLTKALWEAGDTDAMNAAMADRARPHALAEVLTRYESVHEALISEIGTMADGDLQLPYSQFDSTVSPVNAGPILSWIAGNTFGHYPEHARWIREGLAAG